jgi:low temperature requirement protein LtrA
MLIRFTSWIAIAIAAALLVVAQASFAALTTMWLTFAISAGALSVSSGLAIYYRKHLPTVATAGVVAALSGWMIVSSLVFSLSTVVTLSLGEALALGGLAVIGLAINELAREHVVHTLETTTIAADAATDGRHALVG